MGACSYSVLRREVYPSFMKYIDCSEDLPWIVGAQHPPTAIRVTMDPFKRMLRPYARQFGVL